MTNNYRDLASDLSKNALELIKQVLVKHEAGILEEMHDQLKKLKAERLTPEKKAVIDGAELLASDISEYPNDPIMWNTQVLLDVVKALKAEQNEDKERK